VTAVTTDTFTITRAQDGSTAQSITAGYQIAQTVNAGLLLELAALSGATFTGAVSGTTWTGSGENKASDFAPTGLTGATTATRYVGGTTSGAPITGTFAVGDWIIDQTATIWVCTTAGSPGTWSPTESVSVYTTGGTYTATNGQMVIVNGSSTGVTITTPASPAEGTYFALVNNNNNNVTLKANTSQSLFIGGVNYGAGVGYTVNPNGVYQFTYDPTSTHWYAVATNDIGDTINTLATTRGGTGLTTVGSAGQVLAVDTTSGNPAWNDDLKILTLMGALI
jgi:hypothetical protein